MNKLIFMQAAGISAALAERWYPLIKATMDEFDISTPLRQVHFIAQTGCESNGFRALSESFNYSVQGLAIFGFNLAADQREKLGRKPGEGALAESRQRDIANLVYGGRYGNTDREDGWKYRGRGLKQVTFKANYFACGQALGLDLINNPDLLLVDENAARSAGWFWHAHGCNAFADADDLRGLTRRINGGENGLADRSARTQRAREVLLCR